MHESELRCVLVEREISFRTRLEKGRRGRPYENKDKDIFHYISFLKN